MAFGPTTSLRERLTSEVKFQRAIPTVLKFEGGYVNHPADPGGETNFGITKRGYPDLDIKNLTKEQAREIYRKDYWQKNKCSRFPWPFCLVYFDACVNHGPKWANRFLKDVGPDTEAYIARREQFYHAIVANRPASQVFLKGWLRRMKHLREASQSE